MDRNKPLYFNLLVIYTSAVTKYSDDAPFIIKAINDSILSPLLSSSSSTSSSSNLLYSSKVKRSPSYRKSPATNTYYSSSSSNSNIKHAIIIDYYHYADSDNIYVDRLVGLPQAKYTIMNLYRYNSYNIKYYLYYI